MDIARHQSLRSQSMGNHPLATVARAAALGFVLLLGCQGQRYEGEPRAAVSGVVTLDGQPVDGGVIQFEPLEGDRRRASAPIVGGRYDIPEIRGPSLGVHRVRINWLKPTGRKGDDGEGMEVAEVMPRRYHLDSTLEVEVVAGRNERNFEL
jgi:hypothetical protein